MQVLSTSEVGIHNFSLRPCKSLLVRVISRAHAFLYHRCRFPETGIYRSSVVHLVHTILGACPRQLSPLTFRGRKVICSGWNVNRVKYTESGSSCSAKDAIQIILWGTAGKRLSCVNPLINLRRVVHCPLSLSVEVKKAGFQDHATSMIKTVTIQYSWGISYTPASNMVGTLISDTRLPPQHQPFALVNFLRWKDFDLRTLFSHQTHLLPQLTDSLHEHRCDRNSHEISGGN